MCVWLNNMWQCLTAQQTSDSMLPSSITSSSHSNTTGVMTYSVTNDQWMMCFLSSAITRKQYKQFLKKCYRQPLPDDDKLLATASKHYIELACHHARTRLIHQEASIFTGQEEIFAFERTVSRLTEMQGEEYWTSSPHTPPSQQHW